MEYEVTGEIGHPYWELIFEYVLRQCGYLVEFHTVYAMLDKRQDPSLPHWPAAARWWHSRLKAHWASQGENGTTTLPHFCNYRATSCAPHLGSTFVLAALVAMFPGINFVLLDSDCLPLTLFEVEDCGQRPFWRDFQHIQKWHPQATPTTGLRAIPHRPTG